MLSEKEYADEVCDTDLEFTYKILKNELEDHAIQLTDAHNYRPAIAFLESAQALKLAGEKYAKAFQIMNGEE